MLSTMNEYQLTTTMLFEHGRRTYPDSEVVTFDGVRTHRATFAEVGGRVEHLAAALQALGVDDGDRVATFCSNRQEHLELYFAVPGIGAVLHTLNIRLAWDQIAYTINHAQDKVLVVEASLAPLLLQVLPKLETVELVILIGSDDLEGTSLPVRNYEDLLEQASVDDFSWPELDERTAAIMCYTSGTTGNPKGVVYSHRSRVLHSLALCSGAALGLNERDRALMVVPMFHVLAWGMPYAAWLVGSDVILPGSHLGASTLVSLIEEQKATCTAAVPTIFADILKYSQSRKIDLSSLRVAWCGGSAVPPALRRGYAEQFGLDIVEGWGMTETSAVSTLAYPPKSSAPSNEAQWRGTAGRVLHGVEMRVVGTDGQTLASDGQHIGEIEVRGPWVTASYYRDPSQAQFHDGWLRTGDVGSVDDHGYLRISDRLKDIIKSGGEWISSIQLENALMEHPDVVEAAVIGVDDERFQERPLAYVVLSSGAVPDVEGLRGFLENKVAKWWIPERWVFPEAIPRSSVGKMDKRELRHRYDVGGVDVLTHQP